MINARADLSRFVRTLARKFVADPKSHAITRQLVYRVTELSRPKGCWERRIIELGDGKSIGEIIEILYREETQKGAWIVDIALWKGVFDRSVIKTISELANGKQICLKTNDGSQEGMKWRTP